MKMKKKRKDNIQKKNASFLKPLQAGSVERNDAGQATKTKGAKKASTLRNSWQLVLAGSGANAAGRFGGIRPAFETMSQQRGFFQTDQRSPGYEKKGIGGRKICERTCIADTQRNKTRRQSVQGKKGKRKRSCTGLNCLWGRKGPRHREPQRESVNGDPGILDRNDDTCRLKKTCQQEKKKTSTQVTKYWGQPRRGGAGEVEREGKGWTGHVAKEGKRGRTVTRKTPGLCLFPKTRKKT